MDFYKQAKNRHTFKDTLLSQAINIMENHVQCLNEDRLLPVLSNQKMNAYLKEIADVCNINKNFTFHIARHTFAATVALPIETVSKCSATEFKNYPTLR